MKSRSTKAQMARFLALALLIAGAGTTATAQSITYDIAYKGVGNNDVGTGQVTIDTSKLTSGGIYTEGGSQFVTAFTLTVSGSKNPHSNGTFGLSDFKGALGGDAFYIAFLRPLNFSKDLVPQIVNFGIESNGSNPYAPNSILPDSISLSNHDVLKLTSLAPAPMAVPEPSTLVMTGLAGLCGVAFHGWRRRRTSAA